MMIVRFTQRHDVYSAGERAGFPPEVARRLIAADVAIPVNPPGSEPLTKPEPMKRARKPRPKNTQTK